TTVPDDGLQLRSLVKESGEIELSLARVPTPAPQADEVVVRVEATPINPSDIGLLFGAADLATVAVRGSGAQTVVTARIPLAAMRAMAGRVGQSLAVGNEGAGTVVAAGGGAAAQALLGRTVAVLGGAMYSQLRTVKADLCLPLPAGTSAADGASAFVNPLTALGMTETMRREGHGALVHTAAASNLGQMLNRVCLADGIGLVNVVRRDEHVALLRDAGARHVVSTSSASFDAELTEAIAATGATIAFDAIGGGRLAGRILAAMESALARNASEYSRYGTSTLKQVYLYGSLDTSPTEIVRSFGMAWAVGGWLVFPFLQRIGADAANSLKARVARELKTTFASRYTRTVSLAAALQPDAIAEYGRRATAAKVLIDPSR
ncbi:MAG TPA: NADH oxidase, partial [Caldimonas sp.]|nr:NADH oxidase [Caldimonas sp.]